MTYNNMLAFWSRKSQVLNNAEKRQLNIGSGVHTADTIGCTSERF